MLHAEQLDVITEWYHRAPGWITASADTSGLVDAAEVAAAEIGVTLRISDPYPHGPTATWNQQVTTEPWPRDPHPPPDNPPAAATAR